MKHTRRENVTARGKCGVSDRDTDVSFAVPTRLRMSRKHKRKKLRKKEKKETEHVYCSI